MKHTNPDCQCASCKSKRGEYKGKTHPMHNKHHSLKSRRLISKHHAPVIHKIDCPCSFCKAKRGELIGNLHPRYKKSAHPKCRDCNVEICNGCIRCAKCNYKYYSGKNHSRYGKVPTGKYIKYKNIWFRSSWEVKYACYLDSNKVKWLYESKCFDLGSTTYTPDFYLPKTDEYIEIKGLWRPIARKKIKIFKQYYPNIKLYILRKKDLQRLGIL